MKHSIRVRSVQFLLAQALILCGLMAAFLFLSCFFFVKNAAHWHLVNIEEDLKTFVAQAVRAGEVPKRGDLGAYTFFILDTEGKYLLPRMPRSDDSEKLWQEYELKLIYEMQKRRDGWGSYPERGRRDFQNGRYMLRYVYVEKMNWIVAAEGFMPGVVVLLHEMLTPALFVGMALIALAAFVLMLLNANWHFHRVIRAILRSQENNFIAVDGIAPAPVREAQSIVKREDTLPSGVLVSDGIINGPLRRSAAVPAHARIVREAAPVPPLPEVRRIIPVVESHAQEIRRLDDLGNVSIATSDIRSPVLRRVIEELREKK